VLVLVGVFLVVVPPKAALLGLKSFERRTGASPTAMIGAGAFGLLVLLFGIVGANADAGEFGFLDGLFAVFGAIGPLGVVVGVAGRRVRSRIEAAEECPTGNPNTGRVVADGDLREVDGTIDLPGVGDGALTCAYALQKVRGISLRSDAWITVAAGERTRPLALDDGSGELRVDGGSVAVRPGLNTLGRYTVDLPEGEPVPDDTAAFLDSVGIGAPERPNTDHKLLLRPLVPGDTATVVGEYERVTNPRDAFWGVSDGDGSGVLLPGALDDVRRRFARQGRLLIVGGTGMTLVGTGYVAALFLP
jgi:hypothetical protein